VNNVGQQQLGDGVVMAPQVTEENGESQFGMPNSSNSRQHAAS